jgi:hypothetical protein
VTGCATPSCSTLVVILLAAAPLVAEAPISAPGIADNSFLLEEAYNQETGVVQHISTFSRPFSGGWSYTFTQEWPVPAQTHQLSLTVPLQSVDGTMGLGDVALNYRWQALDGVRGPVAFSPRASLLLPTGSSARGRGAGGAGVQVNLPVSARLGGRWVSHTNLGATWIRSADNEQGHEAHTRGLSAGQSLVWLARRDFNLLLELAWTRAERVRAPALTDWSDTLYLSPGVRWAPRSARFRRESPHRPGWRP